jgi:signal peptidase
MAKSSKDKKGGKARRELKERRKRMQGIMSIVKDVVIALVIVIIVMVSLYAYSGGIWPPMVVVESESMMHGDDSEIGVIDTGDLTLVKRIGGRSDIVTWVEGNPSYRVEYEDEQELTTTQKFKGKKAEFKTYDDYGEVIIYNKNGLGSETPVIHRAMAWIEPNETQECLNKFNGAFDVLGDFPDIKNNNHPKGLRCVARIILKGTGYQKVDVEINVNNVLRNAQNLESKYFSGFLTKGDHNNPEHGHARVDQESHTVNGRGFAPIKVDWVVGEAVGELPWFGALKLTFSGTASSSDIPPTSWNGLIITILLIIIIPFILDIVASRMAKKKRKEALEKQKAEEEEEEEEYLDETDEDDAPDEEGEEVEEVEMDEEFGDDFEDMASSRKKK